MEEQNVKVREINKKDCTSLSILNEKVWNKASDEKYWEWKYFSPPFETYGVVVENEKGFLSLSGFWKRPIRIYGSDYISFMAVDVMTDPDYQGRSLFKNILAIYDKLKSEGNKLWGFTNPTSHRMFNNYFKGFMQIDSYFSVFILPLNIRNYIKIPRIFVKPINYLMRFAVLCKIMIKGRKRFQISEFLPDKDSINKLWQEEKDDYKFICHRGDRWLQWRYFENPITKYKLWKATENANIVGYLAVNICEFKKQKKGYIVDWLVSNNRIDIFEGLVQTALKWMVKEKVDAIETWILPNYNSFIKSIHSFLFKKAKRKELFLLLCKDKTINGNKWNVDKFYLTMGDSDYLGM